MGREEKLDFAGESYVCGPDGRVIAFAPRGELYVEVKADCGAADFEREDSIVAYLEVLVGDRPVVGDDVRVDHVVALCLPGRPRKERARLHDVVHRSRHRPLGRDQPPALHGESGRRS